MRPLPTTMVVVVVAAAATSVLPVNILALSLVPTGRNKIRIRPTAPSDTSLSPPLPMSRILMESTIEERTSTSNKNNDNNSSSISSSSGDDRNNNNLSPFLRNMVNEQRELQMNVGKAMDVLTKDYPYFLRRAPDYSIYHDNISLQASNGQVQLSKLSSYKKAMGITRTMVSLLYDTQASVIQSRSMYDSSRTQIRISFNILLVPKTSGSWTTVAASSIVGNRAVHVDGISVYTFDLSSSLREDEVGNISRNECAGKIVEHRIESLLINGTPLQPPYFNTFGIELVSSSGRGGKTAGALVGAGAWS